jgi:hypothetical protein
MHMHTPVPQQEGTTELTHIQERDAAVALFGGKAGETLTKEVVKTSDHKYACLRIVLFM